MISAPVSRRKCERGSARCSASEASKGVNPRFATGTISRKMFPEASCRRGMGRGHPGTEMEEPPVPPSRRTVHPAASRGVIAMIWTAVGTTMESIRIGLPRTKGWPR